MAKQTKKQNIVVLFNSYDNYDFDDYFTNYTEKKVLAVAVFEGRYVGVLVGENNETLEGMTDEAILEMDEWYTMLGGYVLSNATLYNLCENIEEYL